MATPENEHWMGPDSLERVAEQVVTSSGPSGHNVEYVLKLGEWMREVMPEVEDDHLFTLEALVRFKIRQRKLCTKKLMNVPCDHCKKRKSYNFYPIRQCSIDVQIDRRISYEFNSNMFNTEVTF